MASAAHHTLQNKEEAGEIIPGFFFNADGFQGSGPLLFI
jgi:hypothetical protein